MSTTRETAITGAEATTAAVYAAWTTDRFGDVAYILARLGEVAEKSMSVTEAYDCLDAPGARNPEFVNELATLIRKYR